MTNDIIEIAKSAGSANYTYTNGTTGGPAEITLIIFNNEQLTKFAELIQARAVPDGYVVVPVEPTEVNYRLMFTEAMHALAEVDRLLGLPSDGCNDPQITVSALKDYMAGMTDVIHSRNSLIDANYQLAAEVEAAAQKGSV
ncbi:hypothetical protein FNL37_1815 [Methylovorus glucosotrophus]|uniref:hypothetical protein n=1 Tax=Methylovorus glucosotrophus TaxID=266009 RepID=UPI001331AFF3|nr:hypothetical protein [Methylovorus glucosotrophus]KAF0844371.1 hypothetical protein FNL37_1815 [Methylovorus glucosotrophus]